MLLKFKSLSIFQIVNNLKIPTTAVLYRLIIKRLGFIWHANSLLFLFSKFQYMYLLIFVSYRILDRSLG
jgi:hypothetical protein